MELSRYRLTKTWRRTSTPHYKPTNITVHNGQTHVERDTHKNIRSHLFHWLPLTTEAKLSYRFSAQWFVYIFLLRKDLLETENSILSNSLVVLQSCKGFSGNEISYFQYLPLLLPDEIDSSQRSREKSVALGKQGDQCGAFHGRPLHTVKWPLLSPIISTTSIRRCSRWEAIARCCSISHVTSCLSRGQVSWWGLICFLCFNRCV